MFIFGLCSISDDQLSDPSNKHQPKCETGPLSHKNEMFVFGLNSISDDQPRNPSNKSLPRSEKRPPKS